MSKDVKNVPALRFKGFSDAWEKRYLKDVIYVNSGRDYKHLSPGMIPVYGTGGYMLSVNEALSYEDAIGIGRKGTIDKPYLLKAPFWTVDTLFYLTVQDNMDISFVFPLLQTIRWKQLDESTGVPSLSKKTIESVMVHVPKKEEQKNLGNLFLFVDNLIAATQQKLDNLRQVKKSMSQHLLGKSIRFREFSATWEKRKLGDLLKERNVQHPQSSEYPLVSFTVENGVTPKTERYEREQLVRGDKQAKRYKETRLDDIVYNPANLKFGAIARNSFGKAVFSPIYVTFEVNQELALAKYVELLVTQNSFLSRALRYQQGTVYERQSVSPRDLLNLSVALPDKEEQMNISLVFSRLDKLIMTTQSQLSTFKILKKSLLQNLFV
ncbi:restriction endonuclease subunit S [Lacticaseibacillus parahuelsenbergensis]|uniref:Restriction endonuclease subunit S n=1 Tax=Lacticaseibacillus parahuelsenbergensis TaxID=3068305 RepID=A0ABY9L084_9LACO|nr:restriction endonuclease subunit S [Lacticaseibacillus sp. NCIMB 15471]WLV77186.1 restriction endonuclease subunit S [Lacticaseibacillus sp. NCIMB 15471]